MTARLTNTLHRLVQARDQRLRIALREADLQRNRALAELIRWKRKAEHYQRLAERLTYQRDMWMQRAHAAEDKLANHTALSWTNRSTPG